MAERPLGQAPAARLQTAAKIYDFDILAGACRNVLNPNGGIEIGFLAGSEKSAAPGFSSSSGGRELLIGRLPYHRAGVCHPTPRGAQP